MAVGDGSGHLRPADADAGAGPDGAGARRYVSAMPLVDGRLRPHYEAPRTDGAHALVTELVAAAADRRRDESG